MFKKSKLLVILLALALIPATASATLTRVIGFGGEQAGFVIKDSSNPVLFPSTLVYYPHILFAEFAPGMGGTYLDRVGAWYGFGEGKCVLGFDVFKRAKTGYMGMPEIPAGDDMLPYRLNVRWAKPFGNVAVGAALGLYHESFKNKTADNKVDSLEQKSTIIGLDLGLTALDNLLDVAFGFEMPSWTNKADTGKTQTENDGSMLIKFAGRYWYHYGDKTTLIPNFELRMLTDAYKSPGNAGTADDESYSASSMIFRLGLGHNWKPADNVLVLFDFGVQFKSTKYEYKYGANDTSGTNADQYLPYWRCGWEGGVFKWLKIRAGAEKIWQNEKREWDAVAEWPDPTQPDEGKTVTNMYLGGDFNFGPVCIQYLMDQDFVRRGPYFISGSAGAMFHRFSLFYNIPQ